jgi:hypothetical protein
VHCLRRWQIQDDRRQRGVHGLLGRDVLNSSRRDQCLDMPCVPCEFQRTKRELGGE